MKKVVKVMMFVFRQHQGDRQFFVLHRGTGDNIVLTGHVGDFIARESLEEAARREVKEELGVDPLTVMAIDYSTTIKIQSDSIESTEHAFLIEIPDQDVRFLDYDEPHQWHKLNELSAELTYDSQKAAIPKIREAL